MTEQEQKALLDSVKAQTIEQIKNCATKADIESAVAKMEGFATKEAIEEVKTIAKEQGTYLQQLKEQGQSNKAMDLEQYLATKKEGLSSAKSREFEISLKTTAERSTVVDSTVSDRIVTISMPDLNSAAIENILPKYNIGQNANGTRRYIDMTGYTSNAAFAAEKGALGEDAAAFAEKTISVKKIGATIPITEEMLYDYALLASEIQNRLIAELKVKINNALLNGTGVDPQAAGLYAVYATAFAAGGYAGKVKSANLYDLINVIRAQVSGGKTKYMLNNVILNPADFLAMTSEKDELGQYVKPTFVSNDYRNVAGINIVEDNAQAAGTMTLLDSRFTELVTAGDIQLTFGYNASGDFGKGILTVRAVKRLNCLVRDIDKTGVIKVTSIEDALGAINKAG